MEYSPVTVFVCISCRGTSDDSEWPGRDLFEALTAESSGATVTPVECLSVCKRPCTVALAAAGKWTYVVGDLNHRDHAGDTIEMALRYGKAAGGIVPWRERPMSFRKGIISRVPPLGFSPDSR